MTRRTGWTFAIASIGPALLLAHAGCAGRSVSHGDDSGGATGGSSSGVVGGAVSNRAGTGGTGSVDPKGPMSDFTTIDCSETFTRPNSMDSHAAAFLTTTCAKSFCHGPNFVVGLDLRPDQGFAQRLLDVPAKHGGIPCPDDVTMECIPESCPAPGTVKLIDSQDPMASWILATAHGTNGCGDLMPDQMGLTPDEDACLTAIVMATAALK